MKLHSDMNFTIAAVTVFALVAVLIPMAMLMSGCSAMASSWGMPMNDGGTHISNLCTMVKDPGIPDAVGGSSFTSLLTLLLALAVGVLAIALPRIQMVRAIIPVAAAPPPEYADPPYGERLRL